MQIPGNYIFSFDVSFQDRIQFGKLPTFYEYYFSKREKNVYRLLEAVTEYKECMQEIGKIQCHELSEDSVKVKIHPSLFRYINVENLKYMRGQDYVLLDYGYLAELDKVFETKLYEDFSKVKLLQESKDCLTRINRCVSCPSDYHFDMKKQTFYLLVQAEYFDGNLMQKVYFDKLKALGISVLKGHYYSFLIYSDQFELLDEKLTGAHRFKVFKEHTSNASTQAMCKKVKIVRDLLLAAHNSSFAKCSDEGEKFTVPRKNLEDFFNGDKKIKEAFGIYQKFCVFLSGFHKSSFGSSPYLFTFDKSALYIDVVADNETCVKQLGIDINALREQRPVETDASSPAVVTGLFASATESEEGQGPATTRSPSLNPAGQKE